MGAAVLAGARAQPWTSGRGSAHASPAHAPKPRPPEITAPRRGGTQGPGSGTGSSFLPDPILPAAAFPVAVAGSGLLAGDWAAV